MCFDKGKQVVSHTLTQRAAWEWMTDKCSRDSQHVYNYMFWYKHFVAFWDLLARFGAWWVFNNGTCLHGNNHILYHNQIIEIKIELNQKIVCFFFFQTQSRWHPITQLIEKIIIWITDSSQKCSLQPWCQPCASGGWELLWSEIIWEPSFYYIIKQ